ncbi:MFS transporter [Sphaerisporangium siamense]|uniref:MFS family permease/nucleotide-binding universal stress UspA family protein n=1 Tax=Sphaerisporangium siamense TaxID=795645 RepID=A0A7W7G9P4_9ACTN|nr:MFS transporter [Sphaerisporangium siamense]MBB4701572.1 MFS family permease/nucleotide-binding universal stress UspA family protein [Sphaerisporangium siamense]GII85698.1 MFS transporter [Sphaerisporangium siamense]
MSSHPAGGASVSPFKQPKAVFAVAFACVVSFMGIGLVDPILPAISHELNATPSQVTLLFTSYLVVTAVAMLITGWVSSRIGAKNTLLAGLTLIVVFSALAGASPGIGAIVGFRAGWGVGNALFIATSLAVIVASASGGFVGAIILYEAALGVGIAVGPLLGGLLGHVSWRGPFFGVAALMALALLATLVLVQPTPRPERKTGIMEPLRALRHRGLLTMSLTALCYNWAFFTVLGYAPFPMELDAIQLGFVFTGWGALVAIFAVFGAPWLQNRFGIARTLYVNLALFAVTVLVIAIWTTHPPVLITAVIVAGVFIGVNNTVTTQAVMTVSSVERPIASAAYGFVRFIGGGLAPFVAGKLVEHTNIHVPFYIGAGTLVLGIAILATAHGHLRHAERVQAAGVDETEPMSGPVAGPDARPAEAPSSYVAVVTLEGNGHPAPPLAGQGAGTPIVAAVDDSPAAERVTAAAARLAALSGRAVHVLHAREGVVTGEAAADVESVDAARAAVRRHLRRLADQDVPAVGHVLLTAAGHGAAGRMVAEHANQLGARLIVIGAPSHGGVAALMDASAGRELARHAHGHLLIVNPALAPLDASGTAA